MVWICACSPPSSLPCPSSIPSVSVSICGAASSGCTSSTNTHISCKNQTSENEKQDDGPDKTEVQDSSKLNHTDSTALSNDAENKSSEAKKGGNDPLGADNSREKDSSDNAACINGASGDTDDSAFVVLRDNQHVVTSRPMDSASMEQAASLITQCQ
ncbi:hypothetical protein F2Q69_00003674 [Brassica cretica]|uniref:Uncharacterized protein n=1 Tax=Brassica cretica TaxID=69181 RepID=A0A8S9NZT9_BRACR|nr:hypothetical protein F2Q69_00003674 [Brassica cretica]